MKNNTTHVETRQQKVSKILLSQIKSELKNLSNAYGNPELINSSMAVTLINSGCNKDCSIRSWGTRGVFHFVFEYGKRGGIRISYCNNQGLISAVYQADEWECLKLSISDAIASAKDAVKYKAEEEARRREKERFDAAVAEVVRKELCKQMARKDVQDAMAHAKSMTMDELENQCK